jgi:hypothetical protein
MQNAAGVTTLVTTFTPSIAPNPSSKPLDLHDLDTAQSIHTTRTWLRALWTVWAVKVRLFSGAPERRKGGKAPLSGAFSSQRALRYELPSPTFRDGCHPDGVMR